MSIILGLILKLATSSGFGAFLGMLGGFANRFIDLKFRQQEMILEEKRMAHELAKREKDKEIMLVEWDQRQKVATIEGEARTEVAGYAALSESYRHDADLVKMAGQDMAKLQAAVRPVLTFLITLACFVNIGLVWYWMLEISDNKNPFTPDQTFALFEYTVLWILFQGSVVIGWYFATRPGTMPRMRTGGGS